MIIQCPCIGNVQAGCLQYDSRYQAATLEEAMASFPDLTQDQDTSNPTTLEVDSLHEILSEDKYSLRSIDSRGYLLKF